MTISNSKERNLASDKKAKQAGKEEENKEMAKEDVLAVVGVDNLNGEALVLGRKKRKDKRVVLDADDEKIQKAGLDEDEEIAAAMQTEDYNEDSGIQADLTDRQARKAAKRAAKVAKSLKASDLETNTQEKIEAEMREDIAAIQELLKAAKEEGDDGEALVLGKKKRSKKVVIVEDDADEGVDPACAGLGLGSSNLIDCHGPWPDYSYEEMLGFIPGQEQKTKEGKKFAMLIPQVQRAGSKKTALVNFSKICKHMKREAKHVMQYLLAEMGTTGSIDGTNSLIIKGKYYEKHVQSLLRSYAEDYIKCKTCKGYDTELIKDQHTRLSFMQCSCGSRASVNAVKTGFTAQVGKRSRARAAAEQAAGR